MNIGETFQNTPKWIWIVGGGIVIGLIVLTRGSGGSTTLPGTGQTSDLTDAINGLQDAIGSGSGGGNSSGNPSTGGTTPTPIPHPTPTPNPKPSPSPNPIRPPIRKWPGSAGGIWSPVPSPSTTTHRYHPPVGITNRIRPKRISVTRKLPSISPKRKIAVVLPRGTHAPVAYKPASSHVAPRPAGTTSTRTTFRVGTRIQS